MDFCRKAGFEPRVAYETGALESVKSFVRNELGLAILPKMAFPSTDADTLTLVPFTEPLSRQLNLVRSKDRYVTVAARALMVHVRSTILSTFSSVGKPLAAS